MTSSASTLPPTDAIQRVLFIASTVHIYNIPPLTSNKGYTAAAWTADNNKRQIFTARLRIIETAVPLPKDAGESLSTEILLEDPSTGELFAKAPYTDAGAVEAVLDSSRFFAMRVVGEGGMKAVLGIGFEERGEAIDFGICLQECRKVLGLETPSEKKSAAKARAEAEVKKDYGLKEGQTIVVDIGRKGRRKAGDGDAGAEGHGGVESALFSIRPPPGPSEKGGGGAMPMLAPPPSAQDVRAEKRRSRGFEPVEKTAAELGFDDGEFGEFQ
ncbi:hypothetical protein IMSHALPRED_003095 [Imshaugia aleurites]|uniref:NECAP PHear domain-containing protein n=1 Tax=Imshaugia aleurites TaxID=172621 RepID=A0A8H3J6X9_9LECA|nr:hypothetical protein IMSHALPRED_003095 [Imshaugia aleurites]